MTKVVKSKGGGSGLRRADRAVTYIFFTFCHDVCVNIL